MLAIIPHEYCIEFIRSSVILSSGDSRELFIFIFDLCRPCVHSVYSNLLIKSIWRTVQLTARLYYKQLKENRPDLQQTAVSSHTRHLQTLRKELPFLSELYLQDSVILNMGLKADLLQSCCTLSLSVEVFDIVKKKVWVVYIHITKIKDIIYIM